ncbi:hypothetical protein [Aromatoleum toluclasticum]|uniref:hypothetical protein n=1 Tax=Aromatoleum toluclasticum TaxID=92003 RepID=UPI0012F95362|nr:hypothetical protein [Aromatoleum toluclasticum]
MIESGILDDALMRDAAVATKFVRPFQRSPSSASPPPDPQLVLVDLPLHTPLQHDAIDRCEYVAPEVGFSGPLAAVTLTDGLVTE